MSPDDHLRFLLQGIVGISQGDLGQVGNPPELAEPQKLREFQALAVRHGLAGWIERWLPAQHAAKPGVSALADVAAFRSMAACAALLELARALESSGIDFLQFKGPSTAVRSHGDVRLRPFLDLDILVPGGKLGEASAVAADLGFRLDDRLRAEHLHLAKTKHLSQIRGPVRLEIHRRLNDFPGFDRPFEFFWNRRSAYTLSGQRIPCLGDADALWHSAVHGTGHAFLSLKWLADLALTSRNEDAAEEAIELAREARMLPSLQCGFAVLEDLGATVPDRIQATLVERPRQLRRLVSRSNLAIRADAQNGPGLFAHRLDMLPPADRLRPVLAAAFKPNARDWDLLPWLSPDTPVVFSLLRPLRLAWSFTFGRRARAIIDAQQPGQP